VYGLKRNEIAYFCSLSQVVDQAWYLDYDYFPIVEVPLCLASGIIYPKILAYP
jgi:hypothetical protein